MIGRRQKIQAAMIGNRRLVVRKDDKNDHNIMLNQVLGGFGDDTVTMAAMGLLMC